MPTPETISIVHPGVANAANVPPQAAAALIATAGWQLANPADAQYLVTPPDPPAVDVITRDELSDIFDEEFDERGGGGGGAEQDTDWIDIQALTGFPNLINAAGLGYLRRVGNRVLLSIDPGASGLGAALSLNDGYLPAGFLPADGDPDFVAPLAFPLISDDGSPDGILRVTADGYINGQGLSTAALGLCEWTTLQNFPTGFGGGRPPIGG